MSSRLRRFRDALNGRFTTRRDAEARPDATVDNDIVLLWHVRRTNGVAAQRFLVECGDGAEPTIRPLP